MNIYHVWRIDFDPETYLYHEFICIADNIKTASEMIPVPAFRKEVWDHPIPEEIWCTPDKVNIIHLGTASEVETEARVIMAA